MADAVDDLYALPLEEFTPARDAAAREIRRAGDRDRAAQVAKLPKPSPAAWTANQVAREQPELIEAMIEAGGALRAAQEAALEGGGGRGLRDATLAERRAVDAVMTAATAHRPAGRPLSRAMANRLRTTLHAAAADEAIRTALAGGRLVSEAQAGGAWPFAVEEPAGDEAASSGKTKARAGGKKPGGAAKSGGAAKGRAKGKGASKEDEATAAEREAAEAAEREERERAAEQRKALEAELRELRSALRVRERAVKAAEKAAERAARDAVEAGERLEAAQQAAEDAQADAEAAETLRDEAREALGQARDDVARLEERLD